MRLSDRDRRELEELKRALTVWDGGPDSALALFGAATHRLLGFEKSFAYTLAEQGEGLSVSMPWQSNLVRGFQKRFSDFLSDKKVNWAAYNPLRPEPDQRNVFLDVRGLARTAPEFRRNPLYVAYPTVRLSVDEQVRTLVCDGESLMAWFGGFRADPYERRDLALLQAALPALRDRLLLERRLNSAALSSAALAVALQAISAPAFLVDHRGVVKLTNDLGRSLLDRDLVLLTQSLADCLSARRSNNCDVTWIAANGVPRHALVVFRETRSLETVVRLAAQRWRLTPAQIRVIERLALGEANKTIAAHVCRSIKTVELHVKSLCERAGAENRSALVARMWQLAT